MTSLTQVPDAITAGTTVSYLRSLPEYPANAGWTLHLALAGASILSRTATASGADHQMTIPAANTATLGAGVYVWSETVSNAGGEVYEVGRGTLAVQASVGEAIAGQLQSADERLLVAVTAVLNSRMGADGGLPKDIEAYQIDGVAITRVPLDELRRFRTQLAFAVRRSRRGGGYGTQTRYVFTRPGVPSR